MALSRSAPQYERREMIWALLLIVFVFCFVFSDTPDIGNDDIDNL